jgi:anti-anti-sigma factor
VPEVTIRGSAHGPTGRPRLGITEGAEGSVRTLALAGELDLSTAASLCVRLDAARRAPRSRVLIDLTDLEFCDSSGLRALLHAAREIVASAGRLALVLESGDGPVGRLLAVCGLEEHLPVHRSHSDALAALGRFARG